MATSSIFANFDIKDKETAENFVDAFHDMERFQEPDGSPTYKEMYVSVLYNFMIANGGHVVLVTTDNITPLGTPEELENALKND